MLQLCLLFLQAVFALSDDKIGYDYGNILENRGWLNLPQLAIMLTTLLRLDP